MNDMETLREAWGRPEPPSSAARSAARAALLARAAGPRPRPRPRWAARALAVAASAVVIATGVTVIQAVGSGEPTLPAANAQVVLTRIAATVQKKDFTPPRDDQWVYSEARIQSSYKEGIKAGQFTPRTPLTSWVDEFWIRADGKRVASKVDGKLVTSDPGGRTLENTYAMVAALPTDPDELLARFRKVPAMKGGDQDQWIFERFGVTLSQNIVPPAQEAAIFQAMAELPGVTVNESAVDVEGRAALSVSRVADGWRNVEILLDPQTYAYRGRRESAVTDHEERIEQVSFKNGTAVPKSSRVEWTIEKGTLWRTVTRTAVGVVDQAGQKP
ncbi:MULTISPECIES: CU044_5270 family protein [unclassified Nonomuraea]|uniref:CU044_5270 family protein n=1 Tax=unclassified Nonomuraea TaxID=2593643 RepID=UPI0033E38135